MSESDVTIGIGGDSSGATEAFKKAGDALEEFTHGMHAIEGAVGFEKITEIFTEFTGAAARADLAQHKFEGTLRASGQAADPEKFYALAESLEKTTTFSATATVEAASMFSRFKIGQGDISALIPHVQDLAASMGMDLAGASDAMGRAIATGSEGLRGLGLGFTAAEKAAFQMGTEQQRVQMLIAKTSVFQGNAAAMAQTAAGAQKQYKNAIDQLVETLGRIIDKPFAKWFNQQTESVRELTEWFKNLDGPSRDAFAAIGTGLLVLGGGAAAMAFMSGAIGILVSGLTTLFGVFTTIIAPIGLMIVAIVGLKSAWDHNLGGMRDTLTGWANAVVQAFEKVVDYLKNTFTSALQTASDFAIYVTGKVTGKSDEDIQKIIDASRSNAGGLFNVSSAGQSIAKAGIELGKSAGSAMLATGKQMGRDLVSWGGSAGKEIAKWLNQSFDIKGLGGVNHQAAKIAGAGGPEVAINLKDLFAGKPLGMTRDLGLEAGTKLASAMGGGDAGAQQASEFLRAVQRTTGMSEEGLTKLAEAMAQAGKSGQQIWDGVDQFATDVAGAQKATTQALMNQAKAAGKGVPWTELLQSAIEASATGGADWNVLVQKAMPIIAGLKGAAEQIGENLLQAGGAVGSMINAAINAKDPYSAAAAVITSFLQQSKSFQNLVANLNDIFARLAQALNPLIDGLAPIITAIAQVAGAIGSALAGIFRAIQPIFGIIGAVVKPVFSVISSAVGAVMKPLGAAFGLLNAALKPLLPLIKTAGSIFQAFGPIVIQLEAAMNPVQIVLGLLKPAFDALHQAFTFVGVKVLQFAMFVGNIWNTIINFIAGLVDKIGDLLPDWLGGGAFHDFANSIRGADINLKQMQQTIDQLNSTTAETDGQFTQLQPPLDSLNQTAQDMNSPTGFKVSLERFNAALSNPSTALAAGDPTFTSDSSGYGTAAASVGQAVASAGGTSPAGTTVNIQQLTVPSNGNTGQSVVSAIQQATRLAMYRLTGSTEGTYPQATPRTSPTPAGA